ncbi:AraC family transcriptional regulator [Flavobacterium silvaticum]|uniref:Helix-turn-helix domain-containing protein n=1 Tax=Flavobacterium silvaticum TaxID=1852020 RepID=A0A972G2L3_9FLAO|nr:AraC family transcriptional regulator [Flavobacterium silvaticum]NMH29316.1 helix-turn-helix domain-containing protein [Flavobacterium silvaticum]
MKLDFYQPKNAILKKYIEGYYFIQRQENHKSIEYWTFPNNFFIVSVNLGARVEISQDKIYIASSGEDSVTADFVTRYTKPIEVIYKDVIQEITIYFKPLGIHHFIPKTDLLFEQENGVGFNPFPDFYTVMKELFRLEDRSIQIEKLEQYWLSKFITKDLQLAEFILRDVEADLKINEIAEKHGISRQHLNTLFVKYLGKSPSEYRKIHRFRAALLKKKTTKSLTHLTYESLFYDQSHMVKDFKALTKSNPQAFFKSVDVEKENVWLFI